MLKRTLLAVAGVACTASAVGGNVVTVTHYSDAQCPCSARVPQDMKEHFLDNPDFAPFVVDFNQFFVGDLVKNVQKCIHGEGECVAQRHFACAQKMSTVGELSYRDSAKWLDFEACSYGPCTNCAAIEGPHCPCANYSNFNDFGKNDIMERCAGLVGLDWQELHQCGTNATGQTLMAASSTVSNKDGVTYGLDGLAPLYVNGSKVSTKQAIPVVCGPTPAEVKNAVCAAIANTGAKQPLACFE